MVESIQVTETPHLALVGTEVAQIQIQRDPIVERAAACVVVDQKTLEAAGAILTDSIKPMLKAIEASCDPVVSAAHKAHKAATAQRNHLKAPLEQAEQVLKGKIRAYLDEQERAAKIEAQQIEQQHQKELAQRAALQKVAAEAKVELPPTPEPLPPAPVSSAPAKVKGISSSKTWKAEVTDLDLLVLAVASGDAPLNLLQIDQVKLNQLVKALDGQVQFPGIRVYSERGISSRAN